MKNLRNKVSFLINEAILRRELPELEEKLFFDSLNYYITNKSENNSAAEDKLIALLNDEVDERQNRKYMLESYEGINSLGEYLNLFISEYSIDENKLCEICKIDANFFSQLLTNKIKILDFDPQKLARLVKFLNLKIESVKKLLVKNIWIEAQNLQIRKAMARYDPQKGLEHKDQSMSVGLKELLHKANKSKQFKQPNQDINESTDSYINKFEKQYHSL